MKRSTLIPSLLLIYLAIMSIIGWQGYSAGRITTFHYFGIIAITLVVIVLLHFSLKKREQQRNNHKD